LTFLIVNFSQINFTLHKNLSKICLVYYVVGNYATSLEVIENYTAE